MVNSYSRAKKFFDLSVDLANNWISRYYPKNNYKFFGVPIEKVQAFSQHHFFCSLEEGTLIEDIWSHYPLSSEKSISRNFSPFLKIFFRSLKFVKMLFGPKRLPEKLVSCQVLVLASGRHLEDLFPLIKILSKKQKLLVVGKISPKTQALLRKEKISFSNINNGYEYISIWQRLKFLILFIRSFWIKKSRNSILSMPQWTTRLWYLRLFYFPEIAALVTFAHNLFLETKPKVILTTTSNDTFGAVFTSTAHTLGIKVAEMQHGIISYEIVESNFYQSDYYLVWGKIPQKLHPKNAHIVGCPYFSKPKFELKQSEKKVGNNVLVLLSPPYGTLSLFKSKENKDTILDLTIGLSKLPSDWKITLRTHPSYPLNNVLLSVDLPKKFSVSTTKNVEDEIMRHSVVITQPTTAGLIAVLHGKPLLFFDNSYLFEKFGEPFTLSKSAINVPINSLQNIDQYILNLLNDKKVLEKQKKYQHKLLDNYCSGFDADSYRSIEKFIKRIIKENN